jgi:hypothetical protein
MSCRRWKSVVIVVPTLAQAQYAKDNVVPTLVAATHPPVAGDCVSHGRNSHLQNSPRLPRDSFMIAPSMIRYPVQLSVPTGASASDSLSSGSKTHASWSSDRWASASVPRTASGVSGLVGHLLLSRRWRFSAALSRFTCSRSFFLNAQLRWVLGLLGFDI